MISMGIEKNNAEHAYSQPRIVRKKSQFDKKNNASVLIRVGWCVVESPPERGC